MVQLGGQGLRPGSDGAGKLADAEHGVAVVASGRAAAVDVSRLPERHLDMGSDAAQLSVLTHDVGDGRVVPAVLDGHEGAVVLDVPLDEVGGPLGVVGLDGDEGVVERLGDVLGVGQVHGVDRHREVALTAAGTEALGAHLFDVLGPHVDEGDVVFAGLHEESADIAAHGAGTHDYDAVCHSCHLRDGLRVLVNTGS